MPLLTNSSVSYADPFIVSNVKFNFTSSLSVADYSQSASLFGLDQSISFVSGALRENEINLSWEVIRPITKNILSNRIIEEGFSGFSVAFYDKNRNFLFNGPNSFSSTSYNISVEDLYNSFENITGLENISALNSFFIDIVSTDNKGLKSTGVALVDFSNVDVSITDISINNNVNLTLDYSNFDAINYVDVYVTTGSYFNFASGQFLYNQSYFYPNISNIEIPDLNTLDQQNVSTDNSLRVPYFVHVVPYNYLNSGEAVVSSGIKPLSYDSNSFPLKITNLTGYAFYDFNNSDKDLNLQAFMSWDAIQSSQDSSFHIFIEQSGKNNTKYDYYVQNFFVENINSIAGGTGTGAYSITGNVFKNYGSSGIQWVDHTIYVDNFGSYPTGLYSSGYNDLKYISEIRIPSGYLESSEIFLNYGYTGGNSFQFLPSGGQYSGNVYTGFYSDSRYTNTSLNYNSGFLDLNSSFTGICLARRITGFADFVHSLYNPSFVFPITEDSDYFVKVRAINSDETVSEFSDPICISSDYINNIVNLSPLSGKKVIDGSGVANYIPKFSDLDTLTTGTLYYSGSNNLVFTELPTTTTSENLYKLVIENNIVKKQLDTGNGTALIDEFTQASHGFVVGDIVRFDGTTWYKAQADSAEHAEVQGVVRTIVDSNTFKLVYDGLIEGLSGLTPGQVYFLSATTAGAATTTEPSNFGEVSKPVYFALTTTSANVFLKLIVNVESFWFCDIKTIHNHQIFCVRQGRF